MYCRNPILVLVLLAEISIGSQRELFSETACKLEKCMFRHFGEEYATLMMDKDLAGREFLHIVHQNHMDKLLKSQTVATVIALQWNGPYNTSLLPTGQSALLQYIKYPENFQKPTNFRLKEEKPFWLSLKVFYMAIYIRFSLYLAFDIAITFYILDLMASNISHFR